MGLCSKCVHQDCPWYGEGTIECDDFKSKTNADCIRNMNDAELSDFLYQVRMDRVPMWCDESKCDSLSRCSKCRFNWLRG